MNHWNLSSLDVTAKRSLEVLVRPSFFRAIQPWMARATKDMKQRIIQAASLITKATRGNRVHVRNDHQLERKAQSIYQSVDRVALQSKPLGGQSGFLRADDQAHVTSTHDIGLQYSMRVLPASRQGFAAVLTRPAVQGLETWQQSFPPPKEVQAVSASLQSFADIVDRLPNYRRHIAKQAAEKKRVESQAARTNGATPALRRVEVRQSNSGVLRRAKAG